MTTTTRLDRQLVRGFAWLDSRLARLRWWLNTPTAYERWAWGKLTAREAARVARVASVPVDPVRAARGRALAALVMLASIVVAALVMLWPTPAGPVDHFPGWDRMPAPTVPATVPDPAPVAV